MGRSPQPRWYESRKGWYVNLGGKQILLAKGKAGKAEATEAFHRLMAEGVQPARRVELSVPILIDLFLDAAQPRVAPATYDGYLIKLQSFVDAYPKARALDIRPFHVSRWLDLHPAWGDSTRFGYVTAIKRAYSWARKQGHIDINPIADAERPPMGRRTRILTEEQYRAILTHVDHPRLRNFRNVLIGLWETGCRPAELVTLTADRVDLDAGIWTVLNKTRHATGEATRPVALTDLAVELSRGLVKKHPEGPIFLNHRGRSWTRNAMACNFAQIRVDLGYGPEVTAYAFRHRYGTDALLKGQEVATVATLLGHKSTTMLMRHYSHLASEHAHLRDAARAVRSEKSPEGEHASIETLATRPDRDREDQPEPGTMPGKPPDPPA
jgi:integrase